MNTRSHAGIGELALVAATLVVFLSGDTRTDAQKMYAMKMNAWARTCDPMQVVEAAAVLATMASVADPVGTKQPVGKETNANVERPAPIQLSWAR